MGQNGGFRLVAKRLKTGQNGGFRPLSEKVFTQSDSNLWCTLNWVSAEN